MSNWIKSSDDQSPEWLARRAAAQQADAERAERFAAQREAAAKKAAKTYKGGYTSKGFDGRGNRVQDGPEWLWK
ncbi:MAG: hypothetical protein ACLGP3_02180 [Acidobacteriota bacterium]